VGSKSPRTLYFRTTDSTTPLPDGPAQEPALMLSKIKLVIL